MNVEYLTNACPSWQEVVTRFPGSAHEIPHPVQAVTAPARTVFQFEVK